MVGHGRSSDARAGWAAIALMIVIFVSPLCALSSALFSARVLHHVLLDCRRGAAPGTGLPAAAPRLRCRSLRWSRTNAVILWLWHAPGPYAWGLASLPAYGLMQVSLLGSAWLMWRAILSPATPSGAALVALVATIGQMGLLGALIVFAPVPLYMVHLASTAPWGLSPLADQQLAGLLMWVPAILPYLGVGLWLAWSSLRPREPAL